MDFFSLPPGTTVVDMSQPPCRGHYYRYRCTQYVTDKGITFKEEYNLMKRYSCSGCYFCGDITDLLEHVECPKGLMDMDLVQLSVTWLGPNWEGIDEGDCTVEFVKVDEAQIKEDLRLSKLK